jgi:hypothetical protein
VTDKPQASCFLMLPFACMIVHISRGEGGEPGEDDLLESVSTKRPEDGQSSEQGDSIAAIYSQQCTTRQRLTAIMTVSATNNTPAIQTAS